MILPDKNILLKNSMLGIGSTLLSNLHTPQSVSSLWDKVRSKERETISFEKFVLALDFLFTVQVVEFERGLLHKRQYEN